MTSERLQRQIDRLLDQAEEAVSVEDWTRVMDLASRVLALDAENADARGFLALSADTSNGTVSLDSSLPDGRTRAPTIEHPSSFAAGRYQVRRFLGEGGRKRVFLAHDALLDRDVAFALIKTDGLDEVGRARIVREAQAMGRMGAHPHLVSIFDLGEEQGAPYVVTELLEGGDVEGELARAGGPLELTRALEIAKGVARGLQYAHAQGIVHRDLKPGNVWLTADGVAKIGDFGLAVAEGRSRLTQHGMMVGTFGYMPPEQALGNEATPRSDLYSLGAMLYELVTGQQPFTGDTPTAVISQHLNTAPVAPSWHTEHCPPDLEDLILALLAKEPAARPASASAVLGALEGIDPTERSRSRSDSAANPLDRLARGVFVGRERELERLRGALDGALAGHGSLVMLVGEPGIGKTRTTQELETYARMRGAKVLWGRANEAAGAPPYWSWVQVGRAYRDQTDDEVRRRQYQPYAVELQRILPGLRDLFPNLPEPPDADSEGGQFRLYDALTSFLIAVSTETPLVVVLDDLHWADGATLALLTHLTRELGRARMLVLGTYRDTDLDRRHPLSTALADLNREDLFTRIPLRGLSLVETEAYVRRTADVTPAPALVQRIHDETEGNPFFLAEVVNLMAEERTLSAASADVQIPEGVRQALGRRLDRLSEEANALLTTLAVVGREFEHALVLALSSHDDVTTLRLVEEALRARVLEETGGPGRYRFRHALMQQTLLEELSAARRVLLHGQIAEALLAIYGEDNRDHLPELAEHYAESAVLNPAHARLAASTLRRAAEMAAAALAWDQAARLYERCLDFVVAATDGLGEDEGRLWLQLAMARFANTNDGPGWDALARAVPLVTRLEPLAEQLVRLALLQAPRLMTAQLPLIRQVVGIAQEALQGAPTLAICQLLAVEAYAEYGPEGDAIADQAAALIGTLGLHDPRLTFLLADRGPMAAGDRGDPLGAIELDQALLPLAAAAGALDRALTGLLVRSVAVGELDRARSLNAELQTHLHAGGNLQFADWQAAVAGSIEYRRADPAAAQALLEKLPEGPGTQLVRAIAALESGDPAEARRLLPSADHPVLGRSSFRASYLGVSCLVLVHANDMKAAHQVFAEWYAMWGQPGTSGWFLLNPLDETLVKLSSPDVLTELYAWSAPQEQIRYGPWGSASDYLRGVMGLALGRVEDAGRWFRIGLEWASKWGLDNIIGRNLYGLAQVAERRGDHALAMQQLDAAGALFAKRGAKLYLDQVIAKKLTLGA